MTSAKKAKPGAEFLSAPDLARKLGRKEAE